MEKTTGSRKRAKGAPITLTAGAGENTLSQDSEKSGIESRPAPDRTGEESQRFLGGNPLLLKSEFDVTLTQVSHLTLLRLQRSARKVSIENLRARRGWIQPFPSRPPGGRPPQFSPIRRVSHHPKSCSCTGPGWQTGQYPQGTKTISWSWDHGSSRLQIGRTDDSARKATCLPQYGSTNTESQKPRKRSRQSKQWISSCSRPSIARFASSADGSNSSSNVPQQDATQRKTFSRNGVALWKDS